MTTKTFCNANDRVQVADNLWRIYKSEDGRYFMRVNDVNGDELRAAVWSARGGSDNTIDCNPAVYVKDGVEYCLCAYRGKSIKFTADNYTDKEGF